jgi:hypothetical protein
MNRSSFSTFLALGLFLMAVSPSQQLSWRKESHDHVRPSKRGGARLVNVDDGLLWYWGGFFECFTSDGSCDHIWREDLFHYDLDEGVWESITPTSSSGTFPMSRAFFGANFWDNEDAVVVYGGVHYNVTLSNLIPFGDIWFYYPQHRRWTPVTPVNAGPGLRIAPNVAIYHNKMFVFGGLRADFQVANDMWKFNLETKQWTELIPNGAAGSPGPAYLSTFRLEPTRKQIVLEGGNIPPAASGAQTNQTWSYSIEDNSWTRLADMSRGRIHNAGEVFDKRFVLAFGDLEHMANDTGCRTPEASAGQAPTAQVMALDLRNVNNQWQELTVTGGPGPLKRVASTRVGNRMYVVGGYNYDCPAGPDTLGFATWNKEMYSLKLNF